MKRKLSAWDKIKVFNKFVKGLDGYGLIEHCHYCDSINMSRLKSETINNEYTATYKCMKCGAEASVTEVWNEQIREDE